MDPNACLSRIRDALSSCDFFEAIDALIALSAWLNAGGFAPVYRDGDEATTISMLLPCTNRAELYQGLTSALHATSPAAYQQLFMGCGFLPECIREAQEVTSLNDPWWESTQAQEALTMVQVGLEGDY